MVRIKNGGLELGILELIGRENLSEKDKQRLDYLDSLPRDKWIYLDESGQALTDEEAGEKITNDLSRLQTPDGKSIISQ